MFRAISISCPLTENKKRIIKDIFKLARRTAHRIALFQWKLFFQTGSFKRRANIRHIPSELSERYKYTLQYHTVFPVLESFISNVQNRVKEIILSYPFTEKTTRVLLYLNARREWFLKNSEKALWKEDDREFEYEITQEERLILKKIFKHVLKKWRRPNFKRIGTITLDSKCALIQEPEKARHFDLWIRFSTTQKGKPVYLPVKLHDYFHKREGKLTSVVQVSIDGTVRLVKEIEKKNLPLSGEVALDFGMECLFVSDRGDLFGRDFYSKVKSYIDKINRIQREMQRQGRRPTESKRYRRLQHRLREYVKNEIRRIFNKVVELYRPQRVVVEDLKGFLKRVINEFPKSVKRVLTRFGFEEIKRKLQELQEEYDIEVVYVSPAYSSVSCSNCGYVDKENRKVRDEFECKLCGKKLHADVNAGKNLLSRAKWDLRLLSMKQALIRQVELFFKNLSDERFKCLRSKALGLIGRNKLFQSVPKPEVWINVHKMDICPC